MLDSHLSDSLEAAGVSAARVRAKLGKPRGRAKGRPVVLEHGDGAVGVEQAHPAPAWGGSDVLVMDVDSIGVGTVGSGVGTRGKGEDILHGALSTHRSNASRGRGSDAIDLDGGLLCDTRSVCGGGIRCTIGGLLCGVRGTRDGGTGLGNNSSIRTGRHPERSTATAGARRSSSSSA
jgi:hypothetical protein